MSIFIGLPRQPALLTIIVYMARTLLLARKEELGWE